MPFWRICPPNLREKAPSKKNHPCSPEQGCTSATEHSHAAGLPDLPLHQWRSWMSNSLLGNPTLSGESQRLWHSYWISETPDKLMNIYFIIWFLMHILSNETPSESNTQTVQETKTWHKQAWEWGSGKVTAGTCIYKLCHFGSLHFLAVFLV